MNCADSGAFVVAGVEVGDGGAEPDSIVVGDVVAGDPRLELHGVGQPAVSRAVRVRRVSAREVVDLRACQIYMDVQIGV